MSNLIYIANMSIDGYTEDKEGRFDWTDPGTAGKSRLTRVPIVIDVPYKNFSAIFINIYSVNYFYLVNLKSD